MAGTPITSSSQVLQKLVKQTQDGKINKEVLSQINSEVERKMEEFDLQKKVKMARAEQDLSMLVINA